jgi:hypothetical protein
MAGKYQKLRGAIAKFELDTSYQSRVEEFKTNFLGTNPEHANVAYLANAFASYKADKDALEDKVKSCNLALEALSQCIVSALEAESSQKIELSTGALVYLKDTPYASVADKDVFYAWIRKQKMESMLTINSRTLTGMTGEMLVKGQPPPPGVAVYLKTSAQVRYAGKKDNDDE